MKHNNLSTGMKFQTMYKTGSTPKVNSRQIISPLNFENNIETYYSNMKYTLNMKDDK